MSEPEEVDIELGGQRATFAGRERPAPPDERDTHVVRCVSQFDEPSDAPGEAPAGNVPVYVHGRVFRDVLECAHASPGWEVGGILLGSVDHSRKGPYVRIEQSLPARKTGERRSELTFTHDAWARLNKERGRLWPELQVVGWYHTHPGLGVFLSERDRFIHRNFFARDAFVALVVDPSDSARALFQWEDGAIRSVPVFALYGPSSRRRALRALARPPRRRSARRTAAVRRRRWLANLFGFVSGERQGGAQVADKGDATGHTSNVKVDARPADGSSEPRQP